MTAGILTIAYGPERYIRMAKGMVRSLRLHNRVMKVAVVSDRDPASLSRWFDCIIPVDAGFGPGLAQKLHLDAYTPFDETLFVDSDFLFFRDPQLVWDHFCSVNGFGLLAYPLKPGEEHYAVRDLASYMATLGLSRMLMTNTGILYFDRSQFAARVFHLAREIAERGEELGLKQHPAGFFNDEPIFASAVELSKLPFIPLSDPPLFTLAGMGTYGMMDINVLRKRSRYTPATGTVEPALIHFNVGSQQSRVYDRELRRLECGRVLGRTPLPDVMTACVWSLRRRRLRRGYLAARKGWNQLVGRASSSSRLRRLFDGR